MAASVAVAHPESSADPTPDAAAMPSVEAVERLPALGGAELVRVRGRGDTGPPALVAGDRRVEPLADGPLGREPGTWGASFVLPAEAAGEEARLEWPGGARLALPPVTEPAGAELIARSVLDERRARRASPAPVPSPDPAPPAWEAHREALEREVARAAEVAAAARDATAASVAAHAADLRAAREEAGARVTRAEEVAAAAGMRLRGAVAAAAAAQARLRTDAIARGALEQELERLRAEVAELAEALAAERVTREAAGRALAAATADALAARRVRAAEAAVAATLTAELSAERAAHAVTRGTVARLRDELATAHRPPAALAGADLHPSAGPAPGAPGADLRPLAAAQAAAAAAARRPASDAGRLVADLDAAAAALRRRGLAPPRRLRDALVSLAREDPGAAGALLVQMLPALGAVIDARVSYDLAVTGVGIYAVTLADGSARVAGLRRLRPRGQADLALIADPLALAEWLAGADVRIGRFRGRIRRRGRRAALAPLTAVRAAELSFTGAARAGARPHAGLVFRALAHAIQPDWTRGHSFTVAQSVDGETWYLTARDGAGLSVAQTAEEPPDATVALTRAAFDRLLRDEPPPRDELPIVRGDRAAVALLRDWAENARRALDRDPDPSAPAPIVGSP